MSESTNQHVPEAIEKVATEVKASTAVSRTREARKRAASFLAGMQRSDGRWLDFSTSSFVDEESSSSHWVTAYVGASLGSGDAQPGALERARTWLVQNQDPYGGWGFSQIAPTDADSTANVLHFFVRHRDDSALIESAIDVASGCLLRYWDATEGGFRTCLPMGKLFTYPGSSWCDVHISVTALAAEALFLANAGRHAAVLEAAARFLERTQASEGFWEAFWWHGRTYSTYQAARFLAHRGDRVRCRRAIDWLVGVRDESGGWGNGSGGTVSAFDTALGLRTLLLDAREGEEDVADAAVEWLLVAQESDGGFPATALVRVPRPDVHAPWEAPDTCLLRSLLVDRARVFTTATVLEALADYEARRGGRVDVLQAADSLEVRVAPASGG